MEIAREHLHPNDQVPSAGLVIDRWQRPAGRRQSMNVTL
jgi:hypothetical protein